MTNEQEDKLLDILANFSEATQKLSDTVNGLIDVARIHENRIQMLENRVAGLEKLEHGD